MLLDEPIASLAYHIQVLAPLAVEAPSHAQGADIN